MRTKGFRMRALISVFTLISFVILLLTGAELYVAPHDHAIDWLWWTFLGIDQDVFTELHIIFGLLFLVTSLAHIGYNIKPLLNYFKKPENGLNFFTEAVVASILSLLIALGTLAGLPGPANILELGEQVQESWTVSYPEAPIPNTESLTIRQLTLLLEVDATTLLKRLRTLNINDVDEQSVIEAIAEEHDIAPYKIYTSIK